jgi:hypothetical protein
VHCSTTGSRQVEHRFDVGERQGLIEIVVIDDDVGSDDEIETATDRALDHGRL